MREALALDSDAWRYLLERQCDVYLGSEVPARFVLSKDTGHDGKPGEGQYNHDLLQFCGVDQRRNVSRAYSLALARIAATLNT